MRSVAALALSLALLSPTVGVAQSSRFVAPSVTGSYLSGIEALNDLSVDIAAENLLDASRGEPDNVLLLSRAFLAQLVAGNVETAVPLARQVLAIEPADELAQLTIAVAALRESRFAEAADALKGMSDVSIMGISGRVVRAWSELGAGNPQAADATFDQLDESGFGDFLTLHRAMLSDLAGDTDAALSYAAEAYTIDPFVVRIVETFARQLANSGDFETADAVIAEYNATSLPNPIMDALAAQIADRQAPGIEVDSPQAGAAEVLYGLGTALAGEGTTELGVVLLRFALYLEPGHGLATIALSDIFADSGQYLASTQVLGEISPESPLDVSAQVRIAGNFEVGGNTAEAIAQLRDLAAAHPDNIEVLGVLAETLRLNQQWVPAAEIYDQIIDRVDPENARNWRYFYARAIANERAGDWPAAEADFQAALALNPNHPSVLNYLGYSWVDQGMNLEEGLAMIEQAIALDPQNGYIIDSLGWAFYQLGRYEEAVVELERAVMLEPTSAELNDHLGDAYWRIGRRLEATFQWRIAADIDSEDGDIRPAALEKLRTGLGDAEGDTTAAAD